MIPGLGNHSCRCGCAASFRHAVDCVGPRRALLVRADLANALGNFHHDALALFQPSEKPAHRVLRPAGGLGDLRHSRAFRAAEHEALWLNLTALPRDVVVVGRDNPERLLFCYVQAYATVDKPRPDTSPIFVLTAGARLLLKACWNEVYPAGAVNPDVPFLKPGHNKWGVAESHALYWLDRNRCLDPTLRPS